MKKLLFNVYVSIFLGLGIIVSYSQSTVVSEISVVGNQRIDAPTIESYLTIIPGESFTSFDSDESLRALYATGLFSDVSIEQSGDRLIVTVAENPTINLVLFEGNDVVKNEQFEAALQLKSLDVYDETKLAGDEDRILEILRRSGRSAATVSSRIDELENNRVNVVFEIDEGGRTRITSIEFEGNELFSDRRLRNVLILKESNILSWLKRDDVFDAERLQADEERIRQFYYNRGFADFDVISSDAVLDEEDNTYSITMTVEEGLRYEFGSIEIDNALTVVTGDELLSELSISSGDTYDADEVEENLAHLTEYIARTGYSFAEVTPRADRDIENRLIHMTFFVDEGPAVYIERIEISGNTRTRGYVVRREFDVSAGDPYNEVLINRSKRRLDALGYFSSSQISTRPGSAPDRIILEVTVTDRPTGEISLGGGYSSTNGPIAEISLSENNFLGRGHYVKASAGFGEDTEKYEFSFTEPYFLGQRIEAGFDIVSEFNDSDSGVLYDNQKHLGRLRASVELSDELNLTSHYTLERDKTSSRAGSTLSAATQDTVDRGPFTLSILGYTLAYNTQDDPRNPREGLKGEVVQSIAGIGGDAKHVETTGRLTGHYLLWEEQDIVLTASTGAGHIFDWGSGRLRVADHFQQGGETIRGFETNGIGPRVRDTANCQSEFDNSTNTGEPLGGRTYWNGTLETQFPFPFISASLGLKGAVFLDVATLFDNEFACNDSSSLRSSGGLSIIWDSPLGPLRGDFTRVLAKEDFDRTQFFRFGISSRF